jgi:small-conductance mechanosensitive channel
MNVQQINTALITGSFTNDELSSVIDAVKFARSRLTQMTKGSLRVGDTVEFTSTKNRMTYTGTVTKIAIKFVTVKTNMGLWKVPANMLSKTRELA